MNLQELALQNSPQMQSISSIIKTAQNPDVMVNQMIQSNPLAQQARQVAQQYGGFEQAARAIAQQRGIDIDSVLRQVRGVDINSLFRQFGGNNG